MRKINTYSSFNESWEEDEEELDESDLDGHEDDYDEDEDNGEDDYDDYDGGENINFDDEMSSLCDTIKSLFDNSSLPVDIDYEGLNLTVFVFLEKKESMKNLVKCFDVANKLRRDILPQYESEFRIYENKDGYPIICFDFTYDNNRKKRNQRIDNLIPDLSSGLHARTI